MTEPEANFSFANLYAARIVHVVLTLPEVPALGRAEATARLEQRCALLLESPEWAARVDAELARVEALKRPAHLRSDLAFEALRGLLAHEGDPFDDLVNLLFGR